MRAGQTVRITEEGGFYEGMYVLSGEELERVIRRACAPHLAKIREYENPPAPARSARIKGVAPKTLEARRASSRRTSAKRYERYKALCVWLGESQVANWSAVLPDLERRANELNSTGGTK